MDKLKGRHGQISHTGVKGEFLMLVSLLGEVVGKVEIGRKVD
mgnify:CR=1 FL=1